MAETIGQTVYHATPGEHNTSRTLEVARARADKLHVRTVLVATTHGESGLQAARMFAGHDVVAVTHSTGFAAPNTQELSAAKRSEIEAAGARVLTCQHALGGVNRAVRRAWGTYQLDEIIAFTLRIFGQGMKVCVEITLMAADAGLVQVGVPVIALGGTGRGLDTAVVLIPANAQQFFDLRILEVLAKPRLDGAALGV